MGLHTSSCLNFAPNLDDLQGLPAGVHVPLKVVEEPKGVPAAALVADLGVGGRRGEEDDEVVGVGNLRETGSQEEVAPDVLSLIKLR